MSKLNFEFYRGENGYSDGNVEDVILDMVENNQIDEENIIKSNSYPIIYHLSYLRENILNWYPFNSKASALEIGAGCGALTGLLCDRLEKVVAVELTKRRATINYERNKNRENLDIFVGNFNNMNFNCKFDYIILNGVLEYAISFTKTKNPYVAFINYIKNFLKSDGKILISIENRLGLKYFAGVREDHTGKFFSGLNQYDDTAFVRTFTKSELIELFKECNLEYYKFFYPYPDYKFPSEIFTDMTINTEKFGKQYFTFDADRLNLFNENRVSRTLANEKIAEYFSNSFLVELQMNKKEEELEIIYAKLSNDRKKKYRISTILQNFNGKLQAIKKPLTIEAKEHVDNLYHNGYLDICNNIHNIKGEYKNNEIIYPLIENRTIAQQINIYIRNNKIEDIINLLKRFYNYMLVNAINTSNYSTIEFREAFGEEYIDFNFHCIKPANIDLICDNIFIDNDEFIVIDTEWVFDFLVPLEFIMWRLIHDLYENYTDLNILIDKIKLFHLFGIHDFMELIFIEWVNHLANNYIGNNKMKNNLRKDSYNVNLDNVIKEYQSKNRLDSNLYYDIGNGFSENNIITSTVILKENKFELFYDLTMISGKIIGLRWDPIEYQACKCILTKVEIDKGGRLEPINAYSSTDGMDLFLNKDPIYVAKEFSAEAKYLKITGKFEIIDTDEYMLLCENEIDKMQKYQINLYKDFTQKLEVETERYFEMKRKYMEIHEKYLEVNRKYTETQKDYMRMSDELSEKKRIYNEVSSELNDIYDSKLGKIFFKKNKRKSSLRRY